MLMLLCAHNYVNIKRTFSVAKGMINKPQERRPCILSILFLPNVKEEDLNNIH